MSSPLSLRPGPDVVEAAAMGDPYATAIANAWRFHELVKVVTQEEFERISLAGTVTFNA